MGVAATRPSFGIARQLQRDVPGRVRRRQVPTRHVGLHVRPLGPGISTWPRRRLAPPLGRGRSGTGDAVLSYVGRPRHAARARSAHALVVGIYGQENLTLLADQVGRTGAGRLCRRAVFIVVSTTGDCRFPLSSPRCRRPRPTAPGVFPGREADDGCVRRPMEHPVAPNSPLPGRASEARATTTCADRPIP